MAADRRTDRRTLVESRTPGGGEAPIADIVELLDYLVDPSQGQSADDVFARLAEHKRQWK